MLNVHSAEFSKYNLGLDLPIVALVTFDFNVFEDK